MAGGFGAVVSWSSIEWRSFERYVLQRQASMLGKLLPDVLKGHLAAKIQGRKPVKTKAAGKRRRFAGAIRDAA
jgi:hypothetical protein